MRQLLYRPWTSEDDERIEAFAANGTSVAHAAVALKRNERSIAERAQKLGCPFSKLVEARKKWRAF
jgi:orotate phosphoribosyltransferase